MPARARAFFGAQIRDTMKNKEYAIGDRVGTFISMDEKRCKFLGYGVYMGTRPLPPEEDPASPVGSLADFVRSVGHSVPFICLDNGDTVWGCECYWDEEKGIEDMLAEALARMSLVMTDQVYLDVFNTVMREHVNKGASEDDK